MISFVRGTVASVNVDAAVIDIGAVGLAVTMPAAAAARLRVGERVVLQTSLIVREDGWSLFGFEDADQRQVFDVLLSVGGIGPRTAAAALSVHTPDSLRRAVATEDAKALTRIPGVGAKGAARMILELKDKLGADSGAEVPAGLEVGNAGVRGDVIAGLVGLGWSSKEAEAAVDAVILEVPAAADDASLALRTALQRLGRA